MRIKAANSKLTIIIIGAIMIAITANLNWASDYWKNIIKSDAKGYYAYLPAIIIYHDINYNCFEQSEGINTTGTRLQNKTTPERLNGRLITKYYCGTALLELPFFIVAHLASYLGNYEINGVSKLYSISVSIAAIFYLLVGLVYLNSILDLYNITEIYKSWVLILAVLGTNLFYYTLVEPGMSHVYSFAFVSMFMFYSKLFFQSLRLNLIFIVSIILGFIVLIRPINGLVVFVLPFLASDISTIKKGCFSLLQAKKHLLGGLILFMLIFSIQLIYYKLVTGKYYVYSYGDEGFHFFEPHIFDILFSYKKGLFVYTPLYLVSLIGLYYLWKTSKFEFYAIISFLFLIFYVLSSWWMWYYGGSFSSRVFIEYIAIFMVLLAIAINNMQSANLRKCLIASTVFILLLCQVQTYLYRYNIIHWSEMTKEKYWDSYRQIGKFIK